MDPFTVAAIWAVLTITVINQFRKPKPKAAPAPAAVEATVSAEHQLVKTWIGSGDKTVDG